ncbi:hypothetical protein [Oleisolibacter albus]|uniref:hypothetical protein n=1 Tax=Oleisolibacter albus TaxID=2171757 RepID=UPI000DF30930|nr:hypothetical protein [Oleisolibacter albus]
MIVESDSLQGSHDDATHVSETSPTTVARQRRAWTAPAVTTVDLAQLTLGDGYTGADDTILGS